jgi:transposase-like protein
MSALGRILLQKSEIAGRRIFGENSKQEAIAHSYGLTRVTEVAREFDVWR